MKRLFFTVALLFSAVSLFAFPDMTVFEFGEEVIRIQDDELFFFFNEDKGNDEKAEIVRHYLITEDLKLVNDEKINAGRIEETDETYIITIYANKEGYSSTVEFTKTGFFKKTAIYENGNRLSTVCYDETGRISEIKMEDGPGSFFIEYYGLTTNIKTAKIIQSENSYTIEKYDELTGNYCYHGIYKNDVLIYETNFEYFEGTEITKKRIEQDLLSGTTLITEYSMDQKVVACTKKNADGSIEFNERYEYDSDGKRTKIYNLDENDMIIAVTEVFYNERNLVVSEITTNEKTGDIDKTVYEYDYVSAGNMPVKTSYYHNDKVYRVQSFEKECFKVTSYTHEDYFKVTKEFPIDMYSRISNKVTKETYEIEEGKTAFYLLYEYNSQDVYKRIKTYSPEGKLTGWQYFEYQEDNKTLKSLYKFEIGESVYIQDFDKSGNLISEFYF